MSFWATFWWIMGLIVLFAALFSIPASSLSLTISLVFSSLALFTLGRALRCITNILENQKKILKAVAPDEKFVND